MNVGAAVLAATAERVRPAAVVSNPSAAPSFPIVALTKVNAQAPVGSVPPVSDAGAPTASLKPTE